MNKREPLNESTKALHASMVSYGKEGDAYLAQGETSKAIECFQKALKASEELYEQNKSLVALGDLALSFDNLANALNTHGRVEEAEDCYLRSLHAREFINQRDQTIKSLHGLMMTSGKLGKLYATQEKFQIAAEYYRKSLEASEQIYVQNQGPKALWNLVKAYDMLGDNSFALTHYDEATHYRQKALAFFEQYIQQVPDGEQYHSYFLNKIKELPSPVNRVDSPISKEDKKTSKRSNKSTEQVGRVIQLIYSDEDKRLKDNIQTWIITSGVAEMVDEREGTIVFHSLREVPCETAIIILSDAATLDENWQSTVRQLDHDVRMIPLDSTSERLDYNNPEVVPAEIQKLNRFKYDEKVLENLEESLFTDPIFYDAKSSLLVMVNAWETSYRSAEYLMTDFKQMRRDTPMIKAKLKQEKEERLLTELQDIDYFLRKSWIAFWVRTAKGVLRNAFTIGLLAVVGVLIYLAVVFGPDVQNLMRGQRDMAHGVRPEWADSEAIALLNSGSNNLALQLSGYEIRRDITHLLAEYLDIHWEHSELGVLYMHALNDVAFSADTDFIWSANGDGALTKWNRISAGIEERFPVSESPLDLMGITPDESKIVAVDFDSRLFLLQIGSDRFNRQEIPHQLAELRWLDLTADGSMIAVANRQMLQIIDTESVMVIAEADFEEILFLDRSESSFALVIEEDEAISYIEINGTGVTIQQPIPIDLLNANAIAVQDGKVALINNNNELVVWDVNDPGEVIHTGQIILRPLGLTFINEYTLAFNDLDMGCFVYDFEAGILIDRIFNSAPVVRKLASYNNQILGHTLTSTHSQDLSRMLPLRNIDHLDVIAVHRSNYDSNENGFIQEARTLENGMVELNFSNGGHKIIDVNSNIIAGPAQRDLDFFLGLPDHSRVSFVPLVHFAGRPTVVGLLDDYGSMFVASSNGVFYELGYHQTITENTSRFIIPSHSPIVAVHQTKDGYYLEDKMGLYWFTRRAYNQSWDELIDEVRDRISRVYPRELIESIDPTLRERLGLIEDPAADGRRWE